MSQRLPFVSVENITAGDKTSRLNSAIFLLLCGIPCLATILFGAVDDITWAILVILTAVIVALWAIESWKANGIVFAPNVLAVPLLAVIAIGLLQLLPFGETVSGGLTVPAGSSYSLDPHATRTLIRKLIVFLVFLTAAQTFINSLARVRKLILMIVIFGGLMAFVGILQHIANAGGIYGLRVPYQANPFGPFVNEHHFAGFMEMTAGVTLGLIFGSVPREKKFLLAIALVVMVAAILLTSSRGGLLSLMGTVAFSALLSFMYRSRDATRGGMAVAIRPVVITGAAMAVLIVLLVLFLGGDDSLSRGIGLANGGSDDLSNGRLHFWAVSLRIFLDHPVLGAGLDAFGVAFTRYDTWNGVFRIEHAHNDYLQTLAETGILGFACLASFIFLLFKKGLRTIAGAGEGMRREAAIGALAGCFGILIHSFADFPLRTWSNSFFFLILASIATVVVSENTGRSKRRRSTST